MSYQIKAKLLLVFYNPTNTRNIKDKQKREKKMKNRRASNNKIL